MTTEDTTAIIGSRCLAKARELAPADMPTDKLPRPMEHYTKQYVSEYAEWKQSQARPAKDRKTLEDEVSYLSQAKHVEKSSFFRVRDAVLSGSGGMSEMESNEQMRNEFMMDAGRQAIRSGEVNIRDREALKWLIAKADEEGSAWGIVSVSWSRRFILGALVEAGMIDEGKEEDVVRRIRCNELLAPIEYNFKNEPNISCSAKDKLDALCGLLPQLETEALDKDGRTRRYPISSRDKVATLTIYVGDSSTDIGCLVGPAIGVYIGEGGNDDPVIQTLKRLQIDCLPVNKLPTSNAPGTLVDIMEKHRTETSGIVNHAHLVCSIRNFQELYDWISKLG